jgi:CRISPR-associated protein Csd1
MILEELCCYYAEIVKIHADEIPSFFQSRASVYAEIVLSKKGEAVAINPLYKTVKGGNIPISLLVPEKIKRTSGIAPNFLCDNAMYLLGIEIGKSTSLSMDRFSSSAQLHQSVLYGIKDEGATAVKSFFKSWNPAEIRDLFRGCDMAVLLELKANMVFRLENDLCYLHERPKIQTAWREYKQKEQETACAMQSLVSGKSLPVTRVHSNLTGLTGGPATGTALVSFNADSLDSYGKSQGFNAPIGIKESFAYTAALNYLLTEPDHHLRIQELTVLFFAISSKDEENKSKIKKIKWLLQNAMSGREIFKADKEICQTKIFMLGLKARSARAEICFFHIAEVEALIINNMSFTEDCSLCGEYFWLGIGDLLGRIYKNERFSPAVASRFYQSVLFGENLPYSVFQMALLQFKKPYPAGSEQQKTEHCCIAVIKAYFIRSKKYKGETEKEVTGMLNVENKNAGYLLGRMFACLEKVQKESAPEINTGIKERYFSSACSTPARVFPTLLRLCGYHIHKAKYGDYLDRIIEELFQSVDAFPTFLNAESQGYFAIGYYQQRHELYQKKNA